MQTVRTFLQANKGQWLLTAAFVLFAALVPEYAVPVLSVVLFARTVRKNVPFGRTETCLLLFIGWCFVGLLYTGEKSTALASLAMLGLFWFCGRMTACTVQSGMQLDGVMAAGAVSGGMAGAIGLFQMFLFHFGDRIWRPLKVLFNPFWHFLDMAATKLFFLLWPDRFVHLIPRNEFIAIVTRASGTFTNPVYYAVFLCMMVPFCTYGLFYFNHRKGRIVSLVCLSLTLGGIAVSYSRGPYLALAVVFAVLLCYGKRYAWKLVTAGCGFLAVVAVAANGVFRRLLTLFSADDISVNTRSEIWKACGQMLRGHWLFGYGTGVGNVRDALHETYHIRQPHAHNMILEILLENGVVGVALFAALWIVFFAQMLRLCRQGGRARGIAVSLMASGVGFCACGMTDYLFYGMKPMCYLFLLFGLSECALRIYKSKPMI